MKQVLLVFIGGGIGSALRYMVGKFLKTSAFWFSLEHLFSKRTWQFIDWNFDGCDFKEQ